MKVYIAAPWKDREIARAAGKLITDQGWAVTEPWWDHRDVNGMDEFADELQSQAALDLEGIYAADVFILLNTAKSEGKAVELGYALALQDFDHPDFRSPTILAVGTPGEHSSNVFHFLSRVKWFSTMEEVIEYLGR